MSERRTIEDVIEPWGFRPERRARMAREAVVALTTATADGPVYSEDGSLAVIRTDPELAKRLLKRCSRMYPPPPCDDPKCPVCSAAALLAAPAPADRGEDGDE